MAFDGDDEFLIQACILGDDHFLDIQEIEAEIERFDEGRDLAPVYDYSEDKNRQAKSQCPKRCRGLFFCFLTQQTFSCKRFIMKQTYTRSMPNRIF